MLCWQLLRQSCWMGGTPSRWQAWIGEEWSAWLRLGCGIILFKMREQLSSASSAAFHCFAILVDLNLMYFFVFWRRKMAEYISRMWRNLQGNNIQKTKHLTRYKLKMYERSLIFWSIIMRHLFVISVQEKLCCIKIILALAVTVNDYGNESSRWLSEATIGWTKMYLYLQYNANNIRCRQRRLQYRRKKWEIRGKRQYRKVEENDEKVVLELRTKQAILR